MTCNLIKFPSNFVPLRSCNTLGLRRGAWVTVGRSGDRRTLGRSSEMKASQGNEFRSCVRDSVVRGFDAHSIPLPAEPG